MKLFDTLSAKQLPVLRVQKRDAEKHFIAGVKNSVVFNSTMLAARKAAVDAGFEFLLAKAGFEHGDWGRQCELYKDKISVRSIQSYMQLADLSWRWVLYKNPKVKTVEEARKLAIEMVMVSPKPLVELCRELGHVLKFGGYFEEDYQDKKKRKLLGGQIEFDFTAAASTLDTLCADNVTFKFPEDVDRVEALTGLKAKCQLAITRIDEQLKTIDA